MSSKYLSTYLGKKICRHSFFCRSKNFQPAPTMILIKILSGPLCSGRFEVPSKYVAISAICLRENRRHLIWGLEVVTPVVESTTGGICLWQLRHKRAIVAKHVAFITLTFRNLSSLWHSEITWLLFLRANPFPKATDGISYGSASRTSIPPLHSQSTQCAGIHWESITF